MWTFGDGASSTLGAPNHVYDPGVTATYDVSLRVTGPGGSDTLVVPSAVSIVGPAPVASFTFAPTSGIVPLSVGFQDTSQNEVTSWSWDFGDGGTSTLASPTHVYSTPGRYDVTLTVDGPGGTGMITIPGAIQVVPVGVQFIRGDANQDAGVAISDAVFTLGYLFLAGEEKPCRDAMDVNDDGVVNVADPTRLLNFLFVAGEKPPQPFPACGLDPTEDGSEDCEFFHECSFAR